MNVYKKILKLTPESSWYLCEVGNREKMGEREMGWLERRARAPRGQVGNPTLARTGFQAWRAGVETGSPGPVPSSGAGTDRLLAPNAPFTIIYQKN